MLAFFHFLTPIQHFTNSQQTFKADKMCRRYDFIVYFWTRLSINVIGCSNSFKAVVPSSSSLSNIQNRIKKYFLYWIKGLIFDTFQYLTQLLGTKNLNLLKNDGRIKKKAEIC